VGAERHVHADREDRRVWSVACISVRVLHQSVVDALVVDDVTRHAPAKLSPSKRCILRG
jgi:hypothetical protein